MQNITISFIIIIYLAANCFAAQRTYIVPDDYLTIQQAINAAESGDMVEIKPGIYEEAIIHKEGIILKGMNRDKVIVRWDTTKQPLIKVMNCKTGAISELTLTQTNIESSKKNENFFPIIQLDSSSIKILRCTIQNGGSDGIRINGQSSCEILDCTIQGNAGNGILAWHQGANPTIKNNTCSNNGINGIYFLEGAAGVAENNVCKENVFNGISAYNKWTSPELKNNQCLENQGSGIYFGEGARGVAEYNTCKENKWHGISIVDDSSAPALRNNRCLNNKRCGIYYSKGTHITAKGNVLKNNGEINFRQLRNTFWEKGFDELEETASQLRREKSEFTNGNCQLNYFYHSLGEGWSGYKPSREEWLFGILEEWIKEKPESITPRIVMARAYVDFAWHARGGKFARDVPEYAWDIFHEKLKKAWKVLTEAEKLKEKDPEIYRVFLRAGMGLGKSDEEMNLLFEKGIAVGKWYYPLYLQRAIDLLPRWGGGPGELEAFVRWSAELNGSREGEMLYARIVGEVATMYRNLGPDSFIELGFSYPRAKQGHIYILEKYPEAWYCLNTYCLLASIYKDKETAKGLFERIVDNWDQNVWCKEEYFRKYQTWAYEPETKRFETKTDAERVQDVHYIAELAEQFKEKVGYYPYHDWFHDVEEGHVAVPVSINITNQEVPEPFIYPPPGVSGYVTSAEKFLEYLRPVLGKDVKLPYDDQPIVYEPPYVRVLYQYHYDGNNYFVSAVLKEPNQYTRELAKGCYKYQVGSIEDVELKIRNYTKLRKQLKGIGQ